MQLVSDRLAAVNESKKRVWKKIAVYYILTIFFSGVFGGFVLHAGKMGAGNLLYVTGAMWSPALAVFATKAIFRERIRDLPWAWGAARYGWLAYLIPLRQEFPHHRLDVQHRCLVNCVEPTHLDAVVDHAY